MRMLHRSCLRLSLLPRQPPWSSSFILSCHFTTLSNVHHLLPLRSWPELHSQCRPQTPPRCLCPLLSFLLLVRPWAFFWPSVIMESTHFPWDCSPPWVFNESSHEAKVGVSFCFVFFFFGGMLRFFRGTLHCCRDFCFRSFRSRSHGRGYTFNSLTPKEPPALDLPSARTCWLNQLREVGIIEAARIRQEWHELSTHTDLFHFSLQ